MSCVRPGAKLQRSKKKGELEQLKIELAERGASPPHSPSLPTSLSVQTDDSFPARSFGMRSADVEVARLRAAEDRLREDNERLEERLETA